MYCFVFVFRPRSEVPRSSSTARSASSHSLSSNTSSHPRPSSQPNFNNHQLQEFRFLVNFFIFLFYYFHSLFLYYCWFKLIDWLKPGWVRTLTPGTLRSIAPLLHPHPVVRLRPSLALAGQCSLTTPLRLPREQLGAIPSLASPQQCIPISIIMLLTTAIKGLLFVYNLLSLDPTWIWHFQ